MDAPLPDRHSRRPDLRRPCWHWPLIAVAVLVYALVFGEIFLRLLSPQALVPRYVTGGPDGVRANMPGVRFRQWTPEVDVKVEYNRAGQRDDRPPPGPRSPHDCRIALLGDSYFVGFESSYPNSFAARLEVALAKRGHSCRVVNFAVSGFGHAENLRILKSRVGPYQPDLLLMSVHQTDGFDNIRSDLFSLGSDGLKPTGKSYLPGIAISDQLNRFALYRWAQENSHLYSALREWAGSLGKRALAIIRLKSATESPEEAADNPVPAIDAPQTLPAWVGSQALNAELVLAINREGKSMGAKLLLFEIPSSGSRTRYVEVMDKLLPSRVLGTLAHASPLDQFRKIGSPDVQLYLERGQRHWTALGNQTAANVAADVIVARKLLPEFSTE